MDLALEAGIWALRLGCRIWDMGLEFGPTGLDLGHEDRSLDLKLRLRIWDLDLSLQA